MSEAESRKAVLPAIFAAMFFAKYSSRYFRHYSALLRNGATRAFKKVSRRRRAKFETTSIHL